MNPYTLIAKKLSGKISRGEDLALNDWLKESPENETTFQEIEEYWHLINSSSNWVMPDKEQTWEQIDSQIKTMSKSRKSYSRTMLIKAAGIAAMFTFLVGLSVSLINPLSSFIKYSAAEPVSVSSPKGQKSQVVLPDGTKVWLNSESTLTYYTNYNKSNRDVKLKGEAFFDVTKKKDLAFNVLLDHNIKVQVHGTQFNVNAYDEEKTVEVALMRGLVSLDVDNPVNKFSGLQLHPNQKAIIDKKTFNCELVACNTEVESLWRLGRLKIEGATMAQIAEKMERWYGVHIQLRENKSDKRYWLTIKTESLTEMLTLMDKITPIEYKIDGEEVTIGYK